MGRACHFLAVYVISKQAKNNRVHRLYFSSPTSRSRQKIGRDCFDSTAGNTTHAHHNGYRFLSYLSQKHRHFTISADLPNTPRPGFDASQPGQRMQFRGMPSFVHEPRNSSEMSADYFYHLPTGPDIGYNFQSLPYSVTSNTP